MTNIYLIRHAEAEGNIYRRAQGHYQSHISAKGRRQVDALAERFRDVELDALYTSDMIRTKETAQAITRYHDLPIITDPGLREVNMGSWEDRPWGNLSYDFPEAMTAFNDDPDAWRVPGAETIPELCRRIRDTIIKIASRHDGQTIVCVSHGTAIRTLLSSILGVASKEIYKLPHGDNTCVALLTVEGDSITAEYYNDASHLTGGLSTFARQSWWTAPGLHDVGNVRFESFDPRLHPEEYVRYYAETWKAVHGSLAGFEPEPYLEGAKRHFEADPESVVVMRSGDTVVGITELDTRRGEAEGYGWICLCYVEPEYRRRLLGVQLIGHAVSVFRAKGRHSLRLSVFSGNEGAIKFYEEYDFRAIGQSEGVFGPLLIMEKEL